MALPTATIREPLLRVPHVAHDALTVTVEAEGRPFPATIRARVFEKGTTPPAYLAKTAIANAAKETVYFTWDGLVNERIYTVQAYVSSPEGDSTLVSTEIYWDPELTLYPAASPGYGVAARPWEWEDYAGAWMALLAWYYQDDPFTLALFKRVGQEFERFYAAVEAVDRFVMPTRTYDEGLDKWEDVLTIDVPDELSQTRRRAIVLAHLRGRVDASAALFLHSLTNIMGQNPRITEDFNNFTVTIDTTGTPEVQALVEEVVSRILPAHLVPFYNPSTKVFDYPERRAPIIGIWPLGRATSRPEGFRPGGFDSGGFS